MGDWNVDSKKFNDKTYQHKRICNVIIEMVHSNDLKIADLRDTFSSRNHDYKGALDHIYFSNTLEDKILCKATNHAATDHLPIMFELETNNNKEEDKKHRLIRLRCFKGFAQANFNISLAAQLWENPAGINSVDEMIEIYTKLVERLLDKHARLKSLNNIATIRMAILTKRRRRCMQEIKQGKITLQNIEWLEMSL